MSRSSSAPHIQARRQSEACIQRAVAAGEATASRRALPTVHGREPRRYRSQLTAPSDRPRDRARDRCGSCRCRSRQRHNAGCPAFEVLILYPFHPRAGQMVQVEHRKRFAGEDHRVVARRLSGADIVPPEAASTTSEPFGGFTLGLQQQGAHARLHGYRPAGRSPNTVPSSQRLRHRLVAFLVRSDAPLRLPRRPLSTNAGSS